VVHLNHYELVDLQIERYLGFIPKLGYKGPFVFNYVREVHINYVKGNLIIDIVYDGSYNIQLIKTKKTLPEIEQNKLRFTDLAFREYKTYDLTVLDYKKKIFNSVSFRDKDEKILWYYSHLLIKNRQILSGDLYKLSLRYQILRKMGIKK
jgi:hypothetical protein